MMLLRNIITIIITLVLIAPVSAKWVKFKGIDWEGERPGDTSGEPWGVLKSYKDTVKRGGQYGAGKVTDVKIKKCVDGASVCIHDKFAKGETFEEVCLEFEKINLEGMTEVCYRIILCDVTITEIETTLEEGEDEKLEETICLDVGTKKFEDVKTGKLVAIGDDGTYTPGNGNGGNKGGVTGGGNRKLHG